MKGIGITNLLLSNIQQNYKGLQGVTKRLSSGLKINSGADDPSGLAIATLMRAQERGFLTAIQNVSDGVNMVHTIDASLAEISDMIIRIRDLALRACNEAVLRDDCHDRTKLNNEAQSLISEVYNESLNALFNSKKLLQGDYVKDIYATPGTDQTVASDSTSPPAWIDDTHLVINQEVFTDAVLRPSANAGDSTFRIFSQEIDGTANTPVGAPVQMTSDPNQLTDPDADLYFDNGTALNDPQPGDPNFPDFPASFDNDNDGWANTGGTTPAADLDNIDNGAGDDITEVGATPADITVPVTDRTIPNAPAATPFASDFSITWDNAEVRSFTAGIVDHVSVNVDPAITSYDVQVYNTATSTWDTVGSGAGAAADVRYDFAETMADKVRVVLDDDVRKADAPTLAATDIVIAPGASEIYNDVELTDVGAINDVKTYRFDMGAAVDVDTLDITMSGADNYKVYADDASLMYTGSGNAVEQGVGFKSTQYIYVEVEGADTVTNFEAWDAKSVTAAGGVTPPKTVLYSPVAGDANTLDFTAAGGGSFQIYDDTGASIAAGNADGTNYNFAIGPPFTNPSGFWVEFDNAAGNVTQFDLSDQSAVTNEADVVDGDAQTRTWTLTADANNFSLTGTPGVTVDFEINGTVVDTQTFDLLGNATFSGTGLNGDTIRVIATFPDTDADIGNALSTQQIDPLAAAASATSHVFQYDINGADKEITHLDLNIATGFRVYDDTYDGSGAGLITTQAGGFTGLLDLGGSYTTDHVVIELIDPTDTAASITAFNGARNESTAGAAQNYDRYYQYDVDNAPRDISYYDIKTSGADGGNYTVYGSLADAKAGINAIYTGSNDGVDEIFDLGAGAGAAQSNLFVKFELGARNSNMSSITARNDLSLGAASTEFGDVNSDNQNVAFFDLNTAGGQAFTEFDKLEYQVKLDHNYSLYTSNDGGTTWTVLTSGTGDGMGNTMTWELENDGVGTAEIAADSIKIVLESGNDANGWVSLDNVINRLDRDGDLWPDSIEDQIAVSLGGANLADTPGVLIPGAVGGPDDDGDGFVDYPTYYDTLEVDVDPTQPGGYNPFGWNWQSGTGNRLDVPGGEFVNADGTLNDVVHADLVPDLDDADGDTIPDALDPFAGNAEFTTWNDGDAAYKGGNLLFISNRATPNDNTAANQDLYMLSGGAYSRITDPGAGEADNPALSQDGSAAAWDRADGNIYGYFVSEDCGTSTTTNAQLLVNNGENASWSPNNSQVVFERGGNLWIAAVPNGAESQIFDVDGNAISGSNADWSPNGDNIVYDRGGQLYVYNVVTEKEYDINIAGTAASWSPNAEKIAYKPGGSPTDVNVTDLTIEYELQPLQVGADNLTEHRIEFSFPDVRPSTIGLNSVNIQTQQGAEDSIDKIDDALSAVTDSRAEVGIVERRLMHALDDISQLVINLAAARSNIEDADMAAEFSSLVRQEILSQSANAASIHATSVIEEQAIRIIDSNVSDQSLRSIRNRLL